VLDLKGGEGWREGGREGRKGRMEVRNHIELEDKGWREGGREGGREG